MLALVGEQPLGVVERHRLGKALGRQPAPAAEQIGHLPFGHAEGPGEGRRCRASRPACREIWAMAACTAA